jgi:uridine phosphorylase
MRENGIPCVLGKTWTTDAFYRETLGNFEKRKADGCICVEMEGSAVQAVCDFRGLELYMFFTSGDLLDAPEWTQRREKDQVRHTQHDSGHFEIALALAEYVTGM